VTLAPEKNVSVEKGTMFFRLSTFCRNPWEAVPRLISVVCGIAILCGAVIIFSLPEVVRAEVFSSEQLKEIDTMTEKMCDFVN